MLKIGKNEPLVQERPAEPHVIHWWFTELSTKRQYKYIGMYYNSVHLCQKKTSIWTWWSFTAIFSVWLHRNILSVHFWKYPLIFIQCTDFTPLPLRFHAAEVCTVILPAVLQVICDRLPKADSNPVLHQNLVMNSGRARWKKNKALFLAVFLQVWRTDLQVHASKKKLFISKNKSQN